MPDPANQPPTGLTTRGLLGRRYTARLIDWTLLVLTSALILWILRFVAPVIVRGKAATAFQVSLYLILWIGYGAILESSSWQATLGKRWMGMKVYDARGARLAALQSAGRNLLKDGPFLLLQFAPDGWFISWGLLAAHFLVLQRGPVHRAIHDRMTNTWVAVLDENPVIELDQ